MSLIRTRMGIYVLSDDDSLSQEVIARHSLETSEALRDIAQVAPLIPEGGVVIDAGASIGDHTVLYSQIVGPEGEVHAFEPHRDSYEALHANTERLINVSTYSCGLSNYDGMTMLAVTPNVGASFMTDHASEWPTQLVSLRTLDGLLLPSLERLDFIHLDAEGYEPKILNGAEKLISKFRPILLIEVQDAWLRRAGSSKEALLAQITALGYGIAPITANPEQFDVLCLPSERYTVTRIEQDGMQGHQWTPAEGVPA